jgi:hypothetical protein
VSDDWTFQVAPYVWALAVDGDITAKGQDADVDVGFDDLFDELNAAAMLEAEVRKGRVAAFANIFYAEISPGSEKGPLGIDIDLEYFLAGFGGYYRLGPYNLDSAAQGDGPRLVIDPYAGARYTHLDVDLDLSLTGLTIGASEEWIDPIVGVRAILQFTPEWSLSAYGDVGGFGVGSDFQWLANVTLGYRFGLFKENDAKFLFGYRALYQDYSSGSGTNKFEWDGFLHGPVIALAIEF